MLTDREAAWTSPRGRVAGAKGAPLLLGQFLGLRVWLRLLRQHRKVGRLLELVADQEVLPGIPPAGGRWGESGSERGAGTAGTGAQDAPSLPNQQLV